ncbi:sulfatase family protein [Roseimaritima sediminicola]|uniref:sulfatase family protein n=1 Tax=Roseimaritima sediminicola TaxID=2662066 RepID=UPI001298295D|nr:sulfatase [Roseimaritima sediminicola]
MPLRTRIAIPLLLLAATCLLPRPLTAADETASRPNILLLLADNWAWPHASIYGDQSVETPTFDRLAREGVLFTHAFCQVPTCSPARAVLLTGQASHRLEDAANLWGRFPEDLATYPAILQTAGYVTGHTGKGWGPGKYHGEHHKRRNPAGPPYKSFDEFIDQVPDDQPFCFWFGSHDPHQPWTRGDDYRDNLNADEVHVPAYLPDHPVVRETIVDYYAEVQRFDHESNQVLERLRETGRLENTLVVMVGDNGWQTPRGLANVYDAGTHVPMVVHWPSRVPGGQTRDQFISFEDFAPTFLSAAGLPVPESMTGRSILPLITSSNIQDVDWRDAVFLERERHANVRAGDRSYPVRAVRTKDYLYVRNLAPDLWPAGDPQLHHAVGPFGDVDNTPFKELILSHREEPEMRRFFELGFAKRPAEELYVQESDPDQVHNVAGDPQYAPVIDELSKRLDRWMRETDDPRSENVADPSFDRYPYYGRGATKK